MNFEVCKTSVKFQCLQLHFTLLLYLRPILLIGLGIQLIHTPPPMFLCGVNGLTSGIFFLSFPCLFD